MATVRKRKWTHKGVAREAWVLAYTDQGGKRRLKTFDKKKDAEAYGLTVQTEIRDGVHTAFDESVTFAAAVAAFEKECDRRVKIGDMTRGGAGGYHYKLSHWASPHLGRLRLSQIGAPDVQDMVDKMRETYSPRTVSGTYTAVHVLLTYGVRKRWVRRNVLRDDPCRLPKAEKRKAIPTKPEIRKLMEAASRLEPGENLLTFVNRLMVVACGVFAGFRPGETFGLQWEDVDWERGAIRVSHSHTRTDGLKAPKTEAGVRWVPLTEPVRRSLYQAARYWKVRQWAAGPGFRSYTGPAMFSRIARAWEDDKIAGDPEGLTGFVVLSRYGTPMDATSSGSTFWRRLMANADLLDPATGKPKFTPHALRHAAASLMIEGGMDDMNLKAFIGHASISTTKDIYGHLFPSDDRLSTITAAVAASLDATTARQDAVTRRITT